MTPSPISALHDIHTATNDVLEGYREMSARAQPDIQNVIASLTDMHEQHAKEQAAALIALRDATGDDSSMQGTVNKVVVILRDWISDLDGAVLPAVRQGEESLFKEYEKVLRANDVAQNAAITSLLETQMHAINCAIAALPKG